MPINPPLTQVPAPPSVGRKSQPVVGLARLLASALGIPTCEDAVVKVAQTPQMKNIASFAERTKQLEQAIQQGSATLIGRRILLVDDLTESGSTLRRVVDVLLNGGAKSVHVMVLTRTR